MGGTRLSTHSATLCTCVLQGRSVDRWIFQILLSRCMSDKETPLRGGVFKKASKGTQCHKGLSRVLPIFPAVLGKDSCARRQGRGCGRQREQICRNRPYEGKGLRTRSGTCRTRRDQWSSGLPAGCSSRQRSCCRCQTQDQDRPAR